MRSEQFILRAKDDSLGSPKGDASLEKSEKKQLSDFVISRYEANGIEYRILNSGQLAKALEEDVLSDSDINKELDANQAMSLTERIAETERLLASGEGDAEGANRELRYFRAMHDARGHYLPTPSNTPLEIISDDPERLKQAVVSFDAGKDYKIEIIFFNTDSAAEEEGKIEAPADVLSVLRLMAQLKSKGLRTRYTLNQIVCDGVQYIVE